TLVVHPNAGERLRILITGVDEAGLNDDLGTVSVRYDQGSPAPWGVGPQQYDSPEGHYRVSAVISLLP
ncbi:MAG: hypothetical protein ACM3ZE_03325, partial [Myxococcales bacterium]